jgi:hypothetical protein
MMSHTRRISHIKVRSAAFPDGRQANFGTTDGMTEQSLGCQKMCAQGAEIRQATASIPGAENCSDAVGPDPKAANPIPRMTHDLPAGVKDRTLPLTATFRTRLPSLRVLSSKSISRNLKYSPE